MTTQLCNPIVYYTNDRCLCVGYNTLTTMNANVFPCLRPCGLRQPPIHWYTSLYDVCMTSVIAGSKLYIIGFVKCRAITLTNLFIGKCYYVFLNVVIFSVLSFVYVYVYRCLEMIRCWIRKYCKYLHDHHDFHPRHILITLIYMYMYVHFV